MIFGRPTVHAFMINEGLNALKLRCHL